MDWEALEEWLQQSRIGRWQTMAPLSAHTSWKIGGPARLMVWPQGEEQLARLLQVCDQRAVPLRFLGAGTNLLVADEGVDAVVAHTGALRQSFWEEAAPDRDEASCAEESPGTAAAVTAGAGLPLAWVAEEAAARGLCGMEFAAGIPGSFGGALVMNAGAYGGQMSDIVESVRVMDRQGSIRTLDKPEIGYGYRTSSLKLSDDLVLSARLRLYPGSRERIRSVMREHLQARRAGQPLDLPSGGSVFRNPRGEGAGRFIEQAGLKGLRVGNAQISPKHANFIVNLGGAKAKDVIALMEIAEREVLGRFGVALDREVIYWR